MARQVSERDAQMEDIELYLQGERLYGDDLGESDLAAWYADEAEAYATLSAANTSKYVYEYHAWNRYHAFRYLPPMTFHHALGLGSAYGDEFLPIISRIERITVVEPSEVFVRRSIHGVAAAYLKPGPNGALPLNDNVCDLATCFGVLHHVPNVSYVIGEISRVLRPGGYAALREPIVSMGDWRFPRPGLTKRERGIPINIFVDAIRGAGLQLERVSLCSFPPLPRFFRLIGIDVYNSDLGTWLDSIASRAFSWNLRYHAKTVFQRVRPTSAFFVARKPPQSIPTKC